MTQTLRAIGSALLLVSVMTACGAKLPPAVAPGPPKYPEFVLPTLAPDDIQLLQANPYLYDLVMAHHPAAIQYLQAGDLDEHPPSKLQAARLARVMSQMTVAPGALRHAD